MPSMTVTVVSPTIQIFQNRRYYLCGRYFQRNGRRLHVEVWSVVNGRPPRRGFDIHHKDEDRSNNSDRNLEEKPKGEHIGDHQRGKPKVISQNAIAAAKPWHRSEEGKRWHLDHYVSIRESIHARKSFKCKRCGNSFEATRAGFCSGACKSAHRRLQRRDDELRTCAVCSKPFWTNRFKSTRACCKTCSVVLFKITSSKKEQNNGISQGR